MKYATILLLLLLAVTVVDGLGCTQKKTTEVRASEIVADTDQEDSESADAMVYPSQDPDRTPVYDDSFQKQWRDGRAEMSAYHLTFLRYGQERKGNAVAIFVTEPFTNKQRVKADYDHGDNFDVFKLNLSMDFPTGVYDYNIMTSAFMAIDSVNGQQPGSMTKAVTSVQEWCGMAYAEAIYNNSNISIMHRGYFDGHVGTQETMVNEQGISEDALMFWARGYAWPAVQPGESYETRLASSTMDRALLRRDMAFKKVVLTRSAATESITVPAGSYEVEKLTAVINDGQRVWTFYVETGGERRIIRWSSSAGIFAELTGSKRWPYWNMNSVGNEERLKELGLEPRQPNMP